MFPQEMEKMRKKLKFLKSKKSFGYRKNNFGSDTDTEIGPWFQTYTIRAYCPNI